MTRATPGTIIFKALRMTAMSACPKTIIDLTRPKDTPRIQTQPNPAQAPEPGHLLTQRQRCARIKCAAPMVKHRSWTFLLTVSQATTGLSLAPNKTVPRNVPVSAPQVIADALKTYISIKGAASLTLYFNLL